MNAINYQENIIYQIYPLGACDALKGGDESEHKILKLMDYVPHLKKLGITTVLLNPMWQCDYHGYVTSDFYKVDKRLGTNEDLKKVCDEFNKEGISIVFDGVFNHVGRNFFAFLDVKENKWDSKYKNWFNISFDGNSNYNDGFWYEGWEGHFELVKLNLCDPELKKYIFDVVKFWIDTYGIKGLRLDVAYCLNLDFLRELRQYVDGMDDNFILIGETLQGDYNKWMNENACKSVTNYECYKGLYSSFNSKNLFEIAHSLNRQFSDEPWSVYKGKTMLSFLDNHDVTRIMSILENKNLITVLYGLMIGMPGVPCIYYGSEWGVLGEKKDGDEALRPYIEKCEWNDLTSQIKKFIDARKESNAIKYGSFKNVLITNEQLIFERKVEDERVIIALNISDNEYTAHFDAKSGTAIDLITGEKHDFGGGSILPPYSIFYWKTEMA